MHGYSVGTMNLQSFSETVFNSASHRADREGLVFSVVVAVSAALSRHGVPRACRSSPALKSV